MEPIRKHLALDIFKPENLLSSTEKSLFNGKYRLTIETYTSGLRTWECTWGKITQNGELVASIQRNYPRFICEEIADEWLLTGDTHQAYIINLKTRTSRSGPQDNFCWISATASPGMRTLAVTGCIWGGPSELRFYDLSTEEITRLNQGVSLEGASKPPSEEDRPEWPFSDEPTFIEIEWISDSRLIWKHKTLWFSDLDMWFPQALCQMLKSSQNYLDSIDKLDQMTREYCFDKIRILERQGDRIVEIYE